MMTNVRALFPPGHARHIPEAWPLFLSPDQLVAYTGLSKDTLAKVCPVAPIDLGANVLRYHRHQIDSWANSLPSRTVGLRQTPDKVNDEDVAAPGDVVSGEDRAQAALDRVRARARSSAQCRKTG